MFIDSHCHLNHSRNDVSPQEIIAEAAAHNIDGMVTICCRIHEEMELLSGLAAAHDNVWCSIGTHPHDAGNEAEKVISLEEIVERATANSNIVGIGESGLDYYYDNAPREDQEESFRKHIRACLATDLPLIVHTRDAEEDTMRIMADEAGPNNEKGLRGVMHCFSSNADLGAWAVEFGFYMSFSGMITFPKLGWLRNIAATVPKDKLLIETDAPFLAPAPHRGKTNSPALITHTCQQLAELHDMSLEEMAALTKDNFFTLFNKAKLS